MRRPLPVCLLLVALLLAAPGGLGAQQPDSMPLLPVPCSLNGQAVGTLPVALAPSGTLQGIDARSLRGLLEPVATASFISRLAGQVAPGGTVTPAQLRELGLGISLDEQRLALEIDLPRPLQRARDLQIAGSSPPPTAVRVEPADFSAQLSATALLDLIDSRTAGSSSLPSVHTTELPFSMIIDPAFNLRSWVLEGELAVTLPSSTPLSLAAARLVKDFQSPGLRLTAGSLDYAPVGFGAALPMVGIGVARYARLNPGRLLRPLGHFEFYLEQPSQVTVLVNGQPVRYLHLQPGPYNLSDLPVAGGLNTVVVEIRDIHGRVERLERSIISSEELLRPGRSSFAAHLGLPGWQLAPPLFGGYERIGITDAITVGAYTQGDPTAQLVGVEGLLATAFGLFRLDLAGSHATERPLDFGVYAGYRFADSQRPTLPTLSLTAQYRGEHLTGPGATIASVPYKWILQGSVGTSLPKGMGVNLGFGYRVPWSGTAVANASTIFNAPIGRGVSLNLSVTANYPIGGPIGWSGNLSILSTGGSSMISSGSQSLAEPAGQLSVSYQPPEFPGLTATGLVTGPPGMPGEPTTASGLISYRGNRFRAALGQSLSSSGSYPARSVTSQSSLRFGSALVYADGLIGVGRPVTDDFAIFVPRKVFSGVPVKVNRTRSAYEAESDWLGEAVLTSIPSYSNTLARVYMPEAPMAYDLGNTLFLLSLPYRSGAVVRVGTDASVYVAGTLVDAGGRPVALVGGSLVPEQEGQATQPFFTDEEGRFQAYNLSPGSYRLTLAAGHGQPVTLSIPEAATGLYELGRISLSK